MELAKALIMKKNSFFLCITFLSFSLFAEPRNALLIANAKYKTFSSLATPVKEARELKKTLEKLDFKVVLVENANREKMNDALLDFEEVLKLKGGTAFFHYGGHAVQVNGKNYLIPVEADIPDERRVSSRAVDVDEVMQSMQGDTNIVILDACRNNPLPAASGRSATRGLVLAPTKPKNSIIVYSAAAGMVAQDGVFTPILTKKLLEKKELLTVLREVRREVGKMTNGEQNPANYESLTSEIHLAGRNYEKNIANGDVVPEWVKYFGNTQNMKEILGIPSSMSVIVLIENNKNKNILERQAEFDLICELQGRMHIFDRSTISTQGEDMELTNYESVMMIGNENAHVMLCTSEEFKYDGKEKNVIKQEQVLRTKTGEYSVAVFSDIGRNFILNEKGSLWLSLAFQEAYPNLYNSIRKIDDYKIFNPQKNEWNYFVVYEYDENELKKSVEKTMEFSTNNGEILDEIRDNILKEWNEKLKK